MGKKEKIAKTEYNQIFLDYLNCNYEGNFTIVKYKKEFSGAEGSFYRVVCKENTYDDLFVMYCYPERADATGNDIIEIDYFKFKVYDEYANVILQNEYAERLKTELGEALMVKCYLVLDNAYITQEQFSKGLEYCMNNNEFDTHMRTYVVVKEGTGTPELREKIEKFLRTYKGYMQYLYIGYTDISDIDTLEQQYFEHYGSYSDYMIEGPTMNRVEFSFITRENGVEKQSVVKE